MMPPVDSSESTADSRFTPDKDDVRLKKTANPVTPTRLDSRVKED